MPKNDVLVHTDTDTDGKWIVWSWRVGTDRQIFQLEIVGKEI